MPVAMPGQLASGMRQAWQPQRGPTSRELLTIDWQFPVHVSAEAKAAALRPGTTARTERKALAREVAFQEVAAKDPRPLLVLRECFTCSGTDDALLSRSEDNERTVLLSKWFRCVKLPPDVLADEHPFRGLFQAQDPAHLFVARADGSELVSLKGDQSRRELWKVLEGCLAREYKGRAKSSVKTLFKLLDRYDVLDERKGLLQEQLETAIEDHGPKASKVAKLRKKLAKLEKERESLVADWDEAKTLPLVYPDGPPRPAVEAQDPAAADTPG